MRSRYEVTLRWALRHSRFMLVLILVTVVINVVSLCRRPEGLFPGTGYRTHRGTIQADQDISFQAMKEKAGDRWWTSSKKTRMWSTWPASPAAEEAAAARNTARMFISLKPFEQRKADCRARSSPGSARSLPRCRGRRPFFSRCRTCASGEERAMPSTSIPSRATIWRSSTTWAPRVLQKMRTLPELVDVSSDQQNKGLQATLVIDRRHGLAAGHHRRR